MLYLPSLLHWTQCQEVGKQLLRPVDWQPVIATNVYCFECCVATANGVHYDALTTTELSATKPCSKLLLHLFDVVCFFSKCTWELRSYIRQLFNLVYITSFPFCFISCTAHMWRCVRRENWSMNQNLSLWTFAACLKQGASCLWRRRRREDLQRYSVAWW